MSSIDNRIVNMEFNNKGFESGVATTLESLKKLNESLKMKTETGGFSKITESISNLKNSGLGSLGSGVEEVSNKFSAMRVVAMTALANITNGAVNAGKRLVKSLTIEPITSGFSEYETKMGSIQTILTNTAHAGTSLEDVTKTLNELNTYADKTIYNFAEMTKNIGTFTAAGVDLDTSTAAIKGIANLAAASGSTSAQASTAMYQLSQALAAGKVSLQDWNSVVNAGMGGKLFQDALLRTSEVLGTGGEAMIEKFGSFRESLTKGEWLTTEVLTETLKQLSGAYSEADLIAQGFNESQAKQITELAKNATDAATQVKTVTQLMDTMKESVQSGWAVSWEHIIGDKDQATKLLTNISQGFEKLIGPSTEARNNMLKFWNESGGRDAAIRGFTNIIQSLGKGLKGIGDAWKEVFPSMTGEKLTELSTKFRDLTYKFKMNDETAKKIKDTFKGLFDVFKTVGSAIGNVIKAFSPLGSLLPSIGSGLLSVTSGLGKALSSVFSTLDEKVFSKLGDGVNKTITKLIGAFTSLKTSISNFFGSIKTADIGKMFSGIGKILQPIGAAFGTILTNVGNAIGTINFDTIFKGLQTATMLKVFGKIKEVFSEVSDISSSVKDVSKSFSGIFKDIGAIGKNIVSVLGQTKDALVSWQNDVKAGTIMKIASAVGILAVALLAISTVDTAGLAKGLASLGVIFAELALAYGYIASVGGIKKSMGVSASLLSMASAIAILALSFKLLSTIDIQGMVTGIAGLLVSFAAMNAAVKAFSKVDGSLRNTAVSLGIFGASLIIMALALKTLGSIDSETLGSGLFGLAVLLAEITTFLKVGKFYTLGTEAAKGLLLLSAAMVVLSYAVKSIGSLDTDTIIKGLSGMAAVLTGIGIFNKFGGNEIKMMSTAKGLIAMGAAMLVMSQAIKSLGSSDWETLLRGLTAMAGGMAILGICASAMTDIKGMTKLAVGISAMSVSLGLMSLVLKSFSGMSWEQLAVGLTAMAGSLAILGISMYALSDGTCLAGAAAMIVMAGALALLTPQIIAMSNLSWEAVVIGLTTLAGALAIVGIAGMAAEAIAPGLLILSGTVALLGAGCALAGVGIGLMGTGLAAVAAVIAASGFAIIEFIRQLIGILPQIGLKAGEAMANFAGAIADGAPKIIRAFDTLLEAILTSVRNNAPLIADTGMELILSFANALASGIPQLITKGMEMATAILQGIADNIGPLVDAGVSAVVNFVNGVADNLGRVIDAGINLALKFIEGVADGISNNKERLEAAVEKALNAMIDAGLAVIKGSMNFFETKGRELLESFVNGIKAKIDSAKTAVKTAVDKAKEGASNVKDALKQAGRDLIDGFRKGIEEKAQAVMNAASNIAKKVADAAKAALKINSPSKVFIEIGKWTAEGLAVGIDRNSNRVDAPMRSMAQRAVDGMTKAMSNVTSLAESGLDFNPTITPVLDLSNVQAGSRLLNSMIGPDSGLALNANVTGAMTGSISRIQNGTSNGDVVKAVKDLQKTMTNNSGNTYNINGVTYDDGSNVQNAVETLIRAAMMERRM